MRQYRQLNSNANSSVLKLERKNINAEKSFFLGNKSQLLFAIELYLTVFSVLGLWHLSCLYAQM